MSEQAKPGIENDEVSKVLVRLLEFWNEGESNDPSDLYTGDYSGYDVTDHSIVTGPDGVRRQLDRFRRAFPDLQFKAEEMIRDGNRIALYWTARGTHHGILMNIPATGRAVQVSGVTRLYLENGKIKQSVHLWDLAALLRAIGLLPELERKSPLDTFTLKDALTIC